LVKGIRSNRPDLCKLLLYLNIKIGTKRDMSPDLVTRELVVVAGHSRRHQQLKVLLTSRELTRSSSTIPFSNYLIVTWIIMAVQAVGCIKVLLMLASLESLKLMIILPTIKLLVVAMGAETPLV
jgi:hypothetical protein